MLSELLKSGTHTEYRTRKDGVVQRYRVTSIRPDGAESNDHGFAGTARAYGGREAYDKAKAAGKTKLNYRQWVQVRTPAFKAWFGDWEALGIQTRFDAFVNDALAQQDPRGDFVLRETSSAEVAEILRQGGPDVSGMEHVFVAHELKHAAKHGNEDEAVRQPGQRKMTASDLLRLPVVLDAYDFIKVQPRGTNKTSIIYAKKFDDGTIEYVERAIETSAKNKPRLVTKTAWVVAPTGVKSSLTRVYTPERTAILPFASGRVNPDTVSKVTDPDTGEPMPVYHGTTKAFSKFKGKTLYFTTFRDLADAYAGVRGGKVKKGGNILPVFINLRKPTAFDTYMPDSVVANYQSIGFDGAWDKTGNKKASLFIVFSPTQVKSSIGNTGAFSPSPELTKSSPLALFLKGGKPGSPGLYQRLITDKKGRQITHWMRVEARRAAYNPDQLSLDFDADPYATLETRPDTQPAQRTEGTHAVAALRRRIGRLRDRGGSTATLLAARLHNDFVEHGGANLVGQHVASPGDLAALAQVYRDPRFETFRCFYMRGNTVVGESAYSSRLPGAVYLPTDFHAQINADKDRFGADGYYMMHNHPSGRAIPSEEDVHLTVYADDKAPGMIAHVIIDHNEYATLDGRGIPSIQLHTEPALAGTDFKSAPLMDHPLLGATLTSPKDAAIVAKALNADGALKQSPVLIMTSGARAEVSLIASAPLTLFKPNVDDKFARAHAWLRGVGRASGAGSHRFLVVNEADFATYRDLAESLIQDHVVTDVISASGKSLRDGVGASPIIGRPDTFDMRREGRRVAESDGATEFIRAPDGSVDFGEITPDMANAMRRQAGKIRLERGNDDYGLRHIELRHGADIKGIGFDSVAAFVAEAVQHVHAIWKPSKTSQLVVVEAEEHGKVVFIELKPTGDGEFYTVNSAFPVPVRYVEKKKRKEGWVKLWDRMALQSSAPAVQSLSAGQPPIEAGGSAASPSGQSSNEIVSPINPLRKSLPRVTRIEAYT